MSTANSNRIQGVKSNTSTAYEPHSTPHSWGAGMPLDDRDYDDRDYIARRGKSRRARL